MLTLWVRRYLSEQQLAGFDKYKYKSVDTSPLSNYVMHPFWNQVVKKFGRDVIYVSKLFASIAWTLLSVKMLTDGSTCGIYPTWFAPNLMTFSGWLLTLSNFAIVSYYDWDITTSTPPNIGFSKIPRWVWLFCAVSQFLSHTLDGTDGKQARRTNSSSPLGELFDHGLDSSASWLMTLSIFSITGLGSHSVSAWELYILLITVMVGFYLAHWEKYNTSVMYLPWGYDFSQLFLSLAFLLTFIYGPDFWKIPVYQGWSLTHCLAPGIHFTLWVLGFPVSTRNIIRARHKHPEWCPSLLEGQMPFVPLITILVLFTSWAWWSPTNVLDSEPRTFILSVGTVFANITCRLIVSQMSATKCERFNLLILPLFPIVALALLNAINERKALYFYTIFAVLLHLHYGVCVVNQLCDHLHIRCFKVSNHVKTNGSVKDK